MKPASKQYPNETDVEYAIRVAMVEEIDREIRKAAIQMRVMLFIVLPMALAFIAGIIWTQI